MTPPAGGATPIRCDRCRAIHMVPHGRLGHEARCQRCGAELPTRTGPTPGSQVTPDSLDSPASPEGPDRPGIQLDPYPSPPAARLSHRPRRRRRRSLWPLVLSLLLVALGGVLLMLAREQEVGITLRLDDGDEYLLNTEESLTLVIMDQEEEVGTCIISRILTCTYQVYVAAAEGESPDSLHVRVQRDQRQRQLVLDGESRTETSPALLEGRRLILERQDPGYEVSLVPAVAGETPDDDGEALEQAQAFAVDPFSATFRPPHPVRREEWWEVVGPRDLTPLEAQDRGSAARMQVQRRWRQEDREICEMRSELTVTCSLPLHDLRLDLRTEGTGQGRILVDRERGVVLRREETVPLFGTALGEGPRLLQVRGVLERISQGQLRPVDAGAGD